MEYLNCYSVNGSDIEEGIYVSDFESIIVSSPSIETIKKATIEMIPVLSPETTATNNVTETSLVFLHESKKGDKESADHVIIAVDPSKWKLCYSTDNISILDPCGLTGKMLLLVHKDMSNVLIKADSPSTSLQFCNHRLVIAPCGRAGMLRDAVTKRRLSEAASMLPSQYRTTVPITE